MFKFIKYLFITTVSLFVIWQSFFVVLADDVETEFAIIPSSEINSDDLAEKVDKVAEGWKVWENYNDTADELSLWDQFSTWIMNWDTLLDYATYLVKFLGQVGLLVAAFAIIYLWYKKAATIFTSWWKSSTLMKIIMGLLVVIFAYVLVKTVVSMFIS